MKTRIYAAPAVKELKADLIIRILISSDLEY